VSGFLCYLTHIATLESIGYPENVGVGGFLREKIVPAAHKQKTEESPDSFHGSAPEVQNGLQNVAYKNCLDFKSLGNLVGPPRFELGTSCTPISAPR